MARSRDRSATSVFGANRKASSATVGSSAAGGHGWRAWGITFLLLAFMLINFADKAVLGIAAPHIMRELGLSASQYGVLSSGFFILFSISALLVGLVADRYPTRWVLLTMALAWSAAMLPLIGSVGFGVLLASRVLLGAAEGPAFPVANHALQKWFLDADRGLPTGLLSTGSALGVIAGAPALTWVLVEYDWHTAFGVLGVIGLGWCVVWAVLGREGPIGSTRDYDGSAVGALDGVRLPYRTIFVTGTWIGSVVAVSAAYWSLAILLSWLSPYLQNVLGYDPTTAGFLVTLPWAAGAVLLTAQGAITNWLMRRGVSGRWARGFLGGAALIVSGFALVAFVAAPVGAGKMALMTVGLSIGSVVLAISQTVCAQIAPTAQRGGTLGAFTAVYAVAGILAPYLTGRLIDAAPSPGQGYDLAFVITAALLVLGGTVAVVLIRPERDAERLARRGRPRTSGDDAIPEETEKDDDHRQGSHITHLEGSRPWSNTGHPNRSS